MTELPGSAAIGIEAVEWLAEGGGNLIVRVTGRWRRRRPSAGGQAVLVIEAEGRRHRFPALPEPPSLTGASPGMWQLRFSVPGSFAPDLGGRTWLQFGTVIVPLPAAVAPPGQADLSEPSGDAPVLEPSGEAPVLEPPGDAPVLEPLGEAPVPGPLGEAPVPEPPPPAVSEPALTVGEPMAPGSESEPAAGGEEAPGAGPGHVRSSVDREAARLRLERELLARRTGARARVPAEPRAFPSPASAAPEPLESAPAIPAPAIPAPATPAVATPASATPAPAAPAPAGGLAAEELVHTLRRELDARAAAEAGLRARLIDAEARLASRVLLDQRTSVLLSQLRAELDELRQGLSHERNLRALAERRAADLGRELESQRERSRNAQEAIGELRDAMERLRAPQVDDTASTSPTTGPGAPAADPTWSDPGPADRRPADPAGRVEPARLNEALARLRNAATPQSIPDAPNAVPGSTPSPALPRPSLRSSFTRLVHDDADAAGRILLELLSLQGEAYPHPVSYDLVLGADRGCVCVSVTAGTPEISLRSDPRPREEVDFQVFGEPARIARMLTVGALRRRLARRRARVTGRRERLVALEALLDIPLDLLALHRAGLRLDPCAALELVAQMIDPRWTLRERFTLAHRDPEGDTTYFEVTDGRPIAVTRRAPQGRVATTIVCSADELLEALTGEPGSGWRVEGDEGPLTALREWIKRAQSDQSR